MGGVSHEGLWFEDTGGFDRDQNLELRQIPSTKVLMVQVFRVHWTVDV